MVYRTRSYRSRRYRPSYRRRPTVNKTVKRYVRRQIAVSERKENPLQWADILFTGGNVNTTPTMHSLVQAVLDQEIASESWRHWPKHSHSTKSPYAEYQGKYVISYIHYQLRFQQDEESMESTNSFRTLMYSHINTLAEDPTPLLDGTDIDSPPHTEYIRSMYFDRMRTVRPMQFVTQVAPEDPQPSVGTALLKGSKKPNHHFTFTYNESGNNSRVEEGDIRWEAQSDTIGDGLQLYGFIRVYYRFLN